MIRFFFVLLSMGSLIYAQSSAEAVFENLIALKQLQNLIPERNIQQEFAVLNGRKASGVRGAFFSENSWQDPAFPCLLGRGQGAWYYLQSTFSGSPIRILDGYERFQFSPFWCTPSLYQDLRDLLEETGNEP